MKTLAILLLLTWPAYAHQAPLGWVYGFECCSSNDCQQATAIDVTETPKGYFITVTGETVIYSDSRIKKSKDEFFHECNVGGDKKARLICLYVPDKGF